MSSDLNFYYKQCLLVLNVESVGHDWSPQTLHDNRCQCCWVEAIRFIRYRKKNNCHFQTNVSTTTTSRERRICLWTHQLIDLYSMRAHRISRATSSLAPSQRLDQILSWKMCSHSCEGASSPSCCYSSQDIEALSVDARTALFLRFGMLGNPRHIQPASIGEIGFHFL